MQYIKLNNGIEMPQIGLGTFLIPKDKLEDTLIKAYDMGYRQFDTAWRYYNEADIARIFKKFKGCSPIEYRQKKTRQR